MIKLLIASLVSGTLAVASSASSWTGTITDSMCTQDHSKMHVKEGDAACVRVCVKADPTATKYVLFDGKHAYKLSDQKLPEQFAAQKVIVKGTLNEATGVIKVDSIRPVR